MSDFRRPNDEGWVLEAGPAIFDLVVSPITSGTCAVSCGNIVACSVKAAIILGELNSTGFA